MSGREDSVKSHRESAPAALDLAVLTISDTRTPETDSSGARIVALAEAAGHRIRERTIVRDDPSAIESAISSWIRDALADAALVTGGTGISRRDQTFETLDRMFTKRIPGYGELFRYLSYAEIGAAAVLSRATAGLIGSFVVVTMPGSTAAVDLAMTKLILPELGHMVREARR